MALSKPDLLKKLAYFVDQFVYIYDDHIGRYLNALQYRISKAGKAANNLSKCAEGIKCTTELFEGGTKALSLFGLSFISEVVVAIGKQANRKNLKKLEPHLYRYKEDKAKALKMVTRAAVEIFVSYQKQFDSVTEDKCWERALDKLAEDAVRRSLQFYRNNPDDIFSVHSITKSVMLGMSPKYENTAYTFIPPLKRGHTVQAEGREVKTPEIFGEVDIILIEEGKQSVFRKNKKEEAKCGYRLALNWEKLELKNLEPAPVSDSFDWNDQDIETLLKKYEEMKKPELPEEIVDRIEKEVKDLNEGGEDNARVILQEIANIKEEVLLEVIKEMNQSQGSFQSFQQTQEFEKNLKLKMKKGVVGADLSRNPNVGSINQNQKFKGDVTIEGSEEVVVGIKS